MSALVFSPLAQRWYAAPGQMWYAEQAAIAMAERLNDVLFFGVCPQPTPCQLAAEFVLRRWLYAERDTEYACWPVGEDNQLV